MEVFILLDRTGSMSTLWSEAVSSINAYVEELVKNEKNYCDKCGNALPRTTDMDMEYNITLAAFDRHNGFNFDILRESVPVSQWKKFKKDEVSPRGSTPLFDALNRIIVMAESKDSYRTVIVVMTDGYENSSKEMTKEMVKNAVSRVTERGWQVVFLGAAFDAFTNASWVGVKYGQTVSVPSHFLVNAMQKTAQHTGSYGACGQSMGYTVEDRVDLDDFTSSKEEK